MHPSGQRRHIGLMIDDPPQDAGTRLDHRNRRARIVDRGGQRPRRDFGQNDQTESRVMVEGPVMRQGEGRADTRNTVIVARTGDERYWQFGFHQLTGQGENVDVGIDGLGDFTQQGDIDME